MLPCYRSAKEADDKIKKALEKGEVLPTEARFDSNCITPGKGVCASVTFLLLSNANLPEAILTFFSNPFKNLIGPLKFMDVIFKIAKVHKPLNSVGLLSK